MIAIENLNFSYSAGKPLFSNLNLEMRPGKIYGLLGKNGMGKSSLLKCLSGLLPIDGGHISIEGFEPAQRNPELLSKMFYLGEEFFLPGIFVPQYINAYSNFYPKFNKEQFYQLLASFELGEDIELNKISLGQKKKFLLAFGLACNCQYLFLDEPTNGLDIPSKGQFRKLIASEIATNQIILIATHQIRDLSNLLDGLIIMDQGEIVVSKEIFELEDKLSFTNSYSEKFDRESLYSEMVPGGYIHILENKDKDSTPLEIEVFFNAVTQEKETILKVLNK